MSTAPNRPPACVPRGSLSYWMRAARVQWAHRFQAGALPDRRALLALLCGGAAELAGVIGAAPARAQTPQRLLVLGDSLSAGFNLPADAAFPAQLQAALTAVGRPVHVVNGGVSGDTASGGLARLDWVLADKVDAAIVELGANDMLRGVDPAQTEQALDAILAKLAARGIPTLLAGMIAAPGMGKDYEARFNAIYPRLAQKYRVLFFPFFLEGVALEPKFKLADGMHPNREGVAHIVQKILPSVERLLDSLRDAPAR